jgi:hypothetical protein
LAPATGRAARDRVSYFWVRVKGGNGVSRALEQGFERVSDALSGSGEALCTLGAALMACSGKFINPRSCLKSVLISYGIYIRLHA